MLLTNCVNLPCIINFCSVTLWHSQSDCVLQGMWSESFVSTVLPWMADNILAGDGSVWVPNNTRIRQYLIKYSDALSEKYSLSTVTEPLTCHPLYIASRMPGVRKSVLDCFGSLVAITDCSIDQYEPFVVLRKL